MGFIALTSQVVILNDLRCCEHCFQKILTPWELLRSCKKETLFTLASGGVCWLKSGRGESGPQAGEALLGFSSQVCFTFWSQLAPRCWNWSHSEHWARFLQSFNQRKTLLPACYHEEEAQGSATTGLAGITRHPQTSDCRSCLHGLPQPHTRGLQLKNFISHGFGGQMSKVRVLAESVPPGAALCGCVPTWPYCCACISCCLLRHQSYWIRPQPYDLI